jgi:DNA-directed RNA polymerase subunit omega
MMDRSSNEEPKTQVESRYALVMAVAKRAKQLKEGAAPLVQSKSKNPITIALEEIEAGKLVVIVPSPEELAAAERKALPKAGVSADLISVSAEEPSITDLTPTIQPEVGESEVVEAGEDLLEEEEDSEEDELDSPLGFTDIHQEDPLEGDLAEGIEEEESEEEE